MTVSSNTPPSKKELRRSLLAQRRSLSRYVWRDQSDRICDYLQQSPLLQTARTVLAYVSFRQEPDLSPLFDQSSFQWGFPRCVERSMSWHRWSPSEGIPMQPGAFGILEPRADAPLITPEQVDLILVPAVACDRRGYRLGYGGGFYDRMLSDPIWGQTPTIGIVFEAMHLPSLPIDDWDQPLAAVCTEAGFFKIE